MKGKNIETIIEKDKKTGNIIEKIYVDKYELMEWIKTIFIAVIVALCIKSFVFNTTLVIGESMYPTLQEKDRLFINKYSIPFKGYNRGDIVILRAPDVRNKSYIKRVIGVVGDTIEIIDGKVYLNGKMLEESYIEKDSYTHTYYEEKWEVPEGYVFVLGDNRREWASKDSRFFGCIPVSSLKGKADYRYFPFDNFGKLR